MAKTNEATVDTPCPAHRAMSTNWGLIDDLLSGSRAMRDNRAIYLPKFDKEEVKHHDSRVSNSILFSGYADTAKSILSKPFSKPVTIQGKLPSPLDGIAKNVDGQGKTLMQLARELFGFLINRGVAHILVDYPVTASEDGATPNLGQERIAGYRPRFIAISPDDLIGWRTEPDASGRPVLTRIRIAERCTESDGVWGEKVVQCVRVIEREQWQLYIKIDDEYVLFNEGVNSLGKIALATAYANQTGFLTARPPLKELAEMNLAHYRSDSDQRNILHMARTITLFLKGFTPEEAEKIALGPNQIISTSNENASASFVEHSGKAIEAGHRDVEKLEERMVMLGLQPFTRRVGNQTATGQGIDESRANCDIQAWVMGLEGLLYDAYALAAEWVGQELPEDFKVNLFNDFAIWMRAGQDTEQLLKMRQGGELSRLTFLREVKRRAILSETVDAEKEAEAIEAEGPALGMIGLGEPGGE